MKRILSFIFAIAFAITASAQTAKAIWTAGDKTLTFVYNTTNYTAGTSKYNGQTVTAVWTGAAVTATATNAPGWLATVQGSVTKVVFTSAFASVKPTSCHRWFYNCKKLASFTGLTYLTTTNVTNMSFMFYGCEALTTIDLSKFNTANVTNMEAMFRRCSALTSLVLTSFNTTKVTNMRAMFEQCKKLTTLNITKFNTANVTNMQDMFCYCQALTSLNLSNFNTAKVTNMAGMFEYLSSATSINLTSFNTAKVTNMAGMFNGCSSLTSLDVSKFNTANVVYMGYTLWSELNMSVGLYDDFSSPGNVNYGGMFKNCSKLTTLNLSSFNTAKVTGMRDMFYGCSSLTTLTYNTTNFNTANVKNMQSMFRDCSKLGTLNVSKFNTAKVTDMSYMFYGCSSLPSLNVSTFNTAVVTDMQYMFYGCSALTSLNINGNSFTAAKVTNMQYMFYNCSKLTALNLSKFNTAQVTNMRDMFASCSSLTTLTFGTNFKTNNVTDMYEMFDSCRSLTSLNLSTFVTSKVTNFTYMFYNCRSLMNIDLSQMSTAAATGYSSMFTSVPAQCFVYMPAGVLEAIRNQRSKNLVLKSGSNWTCAKCEMTVEQEYDIWYQFKATALTVASSSASAHCLYKDGTAYYVPISTYTNLTIPKGKDKISATFTGQAVWTAGNKTLTFVGTNKWKKGDTFTGGQQITAVWGGTDVTASANTPAWISNTTYNVKASVTNVIFDTSFQYVKPTKCQNWFSGCSKLQTITNPGNLTTSEVTTMAGMFNGCSALSNLPLSTFNTAKVMTMSDMFNGCTKLATLTLSANFTTANVTSMANMFKGCAALTALDLTSFNTSKVTTMANMFNGCSKLMSIDAINFRPDALTTYTTMFTGLPDLCFVYIPTGMPDGLKNLKAKNLVLRSSYTSSSYTCANCWMKQSTEYNILHTFTATKLTVDSSTSPTHALYNNNAFVRNIYAYANESIPIGKDKLVPTYPQAIWTSSNKTLTFLLSETLYKSGNTYNGQTINGVWSGTAVTATGTTTPGWVNTVKGTMTTVVFDASFGDVYPTSLQNWFTQCEKLTTITNFSNLKWNSATSSAYMFNGCKGLETLTFYNSAYAPVLTTMEGMFKNCTGLKTIGYSGPGLRTPALTNLKALCMGCTSLTSIRTTGNNGNVIFNTTNVTTMESMFQDCKALTSLSLGSSFNTQNVTNMKAVFAGCTALRSLSLGNSFNTAKVTDMSSMFANCSSLPSLTLNFNTAAVKNMSSMFSGCSGLTTLSINGFNTAAVTNMNSMFAGCSGLTTLNITNFTTTAVTDMSSMFAGCSGLSKLILSNFSTPAVTNMSNMFNGCTALKALDISNLSTTKVTTYTDMFKDVPEMCFIYTPAAVRAEIRNMRTKNLVLKDGSGVWTCANCWMKIYETYGILYDFTAIALTADESDATSVWLYKENVPLRKITAFANEAIPKGNDKLSEGGAPQVLWTEGNTTLTFLVPEDLYAVGDTYNGETITKVWATFNTGDMSTPTWLSTVQSTLSNVVFDNSFATYLPESCSNWFCNCTNLTTVTGWENLKTSEVISFYQMFKYDAKLQSVDVSGFETSNCRRFQDMFQRCSSLTSIDVTNFNTAKATSIGGMFAYCSGLTELDLSSFETPLVTDFGWIVRQCTNLQSLDISNFNTTKLTVNGYAFEGVSDKCFIFIPNSQWNKLGVTTKNYNLVLKQTNGTFTCAKCWVEHDTEHKIYHDFTATNLTINGSDADTHYLYCNDVLHSKITGLTGISIPKGRDRFAKFGPHAIWTEDDKTLTFDYLAPVDLASNTYNGKSVTQKWEGFDVTAAGISGPAWKSIVSPTEEKVVFADDFKHIHPSSCREWFSGCENLTTIEGWNNLNTEDVTDMGGMFQGCSGLTTLDLSSLNTKNVTDMSNMFKGCTGLPYFDLQDMNTEKVTTSVGMFDEIPNNIFIYMADGTKGDIIAQRPENMVLKYAEDDLRCANCVLYDAKTLTLPYGFMATDGVTYERNIPANTGNAYTVFLPYECPVPEGMTAYTLRTDEQYLRSEKKIVFEPVMTGVMEAYKPYLIANTGTDITNLNTDFDTEVLPTTTVGTALSIDDLCFSGTVRTIDNAEAAAMQAYIMQTGNKWKKVMTSSPSAYIPAYRAYIVSPTGNIKTWLSQFDEMPDGIMSIDNEQWTMDNKPVAVYDLSGRKLSKMQRGVNIVNGRKVVIK